MVSKMQVGVDSFAEAFDDSGSLAFSPSERLRNLVEQIEYADQVGLDVFGVGEHPGGSSSIQPLLSS